MKSKSQIVFLNELKKINPEVLPLEEYKRSDEKILVRCLKCNYEWKTIPSSLLRGKGCPKCAGNMMKTTDEFKKEISIIIPSVEILEEYKGDGVKILARCKICNHKWKIKPNDLKNNHGCPICGRKTATIKRTKPKEEFEKEIKKHNSNVDIIGEYKGSNKKVLTRCKICGNEWMALPQGLLHGQGCSNCNDKHTSFMEKFILISFQKLLGKEKVISRDKDLIKKELDIYIPDYKIAIEPGSWYYHDKKLERDLRKRKDCEKLGVTLITIYDYYPKEYKKPFNDNCYVYSGYLNEPGYRRLIKLVEQIAQKIGLSSINLNWNQIADEAYKECRYNANKNFIKKLREINPNIEPLEEYKGSSIPILVNNKDCDHLAWKISPSSLYAGQSCPICAHIKTAERLTHSHEQFIEDLKKVNSNIIVLGKYTHNKEKILVRCVKCNNEWYTTPHSLLGGRGCPKCGRKEANKKITMTHENFIKKIKRINNKIEIIGEYTGVHKKIKIKCLKCDNKWETDPNVILQGHGCPNCYGNRKKTPEEFKREMSIINQDISIEGEYQNNRTKVSVKCKRCGNKWDASPKTLLRGSGCPICVRKKK